MHLHDYTNIKYTFMIMPKQDLENEKWYARFKLKKTMRHIIITISKLVDKHKLS